MIKNKNVGPTQDIPWAGRSTAYNASGVLIGAGSLVYATGQRGLVREVTMADADVALPAGTTLWVSRHEIPNGEYGDILPWRLLINVNTAGSATGRPVYLSSTAGGWSLTPGATSILVGMVTSVHAATGSVLLQPQMGAAAKGFVSRADSPALDQAAGVTAFGTTYTIPVGALVAGTTLRIRAVVRISTALNGTNTLDTALRLGGAVVLQSHESTGKALHTRCVLDALYTVRTDPSGTAALAGVGTAIWTDTVAVVTTNPVAGLPTIASNGALVVDVVASASGGSTAGKYVLEQLIVEID